MDVKTTIKQILLAFEQSSTKIKYNEIYEYEDGPNHVKQITVSFGITEYGNLQNLLKSYCSKNGTYSSEFSDYIPLIGSKPLASNQDFIKLLKESASDPIMQETQEEAFDTMYINPAYAFCAKNEITENLSKLVICDSYLQSGSILSTIRNMFSESLPSNGGDEKSWIKQYCDSRRSWLANHSMKILHSTVYRMDFMLARIKNDDWDLSQFPFVANDVKING